jgi:hypothetical protein
VLLAIAENTFDRRPAALRHAIAFVPRGAAIDRAPALLAGLGHGIVLRDMWRHADVAQRRDVIGRVVSLVL